MKTSRVLVGSGRGWWAVASLLRILLCCPSVYYVCLSHWFVTFGPERIDFSFTLQTSFPLLWGNGKLISFSSLFKWVIYVMTFMSFRIILV